MWVQWWLRHTIGAGLAVDGLAHADSLGYLRPDRLVRGPGDVSPRTPPTTRRTDAAGDEELCIPLPPGRESSHRPRSHRKVHVAPLRDAGAGAHSTVYHHLHGPDLCHLVPDLRGLSRLVHGRTGLEERRGGCPSISEYLGRGVHRISADHLRHQDPLCEQVEERRIRAAGGTLGAHDYWRRLSAHGSFLVWMDIEPAHFMGAASDCRRAHRDGPPGDLHAGSQLHHRHVHDVRQLGHCRQYPRPECHGCRLPTICNADVSQAGRQLGFQLVGILDRRHGPDPGSVFFLWSEASQHEQIQATTLNLVESTTTTITTDQCIF